MGAAVYVQGRYEGEDGGAAAAAEEETEYDSAPKGVAFNSARNVAHSARSFGSGLQVDDLGHEYGIENPPYYEERFENPSFHLLRTSTVKRGESGSDRKLSIDREDGADASTPSPKMINFVNSSQRNVSQRGFDEDAVFGIDRNRCVGTMSNTTLVAVPTLLTEPLPSAPKYGGESRERRHWKPIELGR